ncbi:2fcd5d3f-c17a-4594-8967-3b4849bd61ef [Sclerotinia trifoliorum]|uniref:2fcd5d3f-c17a-4594-8967-3b4849bd61ef n=1 Tax=Sclerotinia trifoliorum TaxID=28548 RepID=A0A8H2ZPQ0_9HELO|nr:2fcd5d3f-c17a-4594-8967-3b4849bd61ef [Sclerotinia trifoliorum]
MISMHHTITAIHPLDLIYNFEQFCIPKVTFSNSDTITIVTIFSSWAIHLVAISLVEPKQNNHIAMQLSRGAIFAITGACFDNFQNVHDQYTLETQDARTQRTIGTQDVHVQQILEIQDIHIQRRLGVQDWHQTVLKKESSNLIKFLRQTSKMHRNTKHGLIFLALLLICGGGIALFFVVWLKPHSQHQSATKRWVAATQQHDSHIRNSPLDDAAVGHSSFENSEFPQLYRYHTRRNTPSRHRNRHRSSYPETDIGNLGSYSSIVPTSTAI